MKIRYKKNTGVFYLLLGILWIAMGIFGLSVERDYPFFDYAFTAFGILNILMFLYQWNYQYLKIENGVVQKSLFHASPRRITLKNVVWIKKFAGDYILISDEKKFHISYDLIEKKSLLELDKILSQLNLPPEKTPFH